jgi:hypothetical protein
MPSLFYIKEATLNPEEGEELMNAITQCCIDGNPDNRKIYTNGSSKYIQTDIKFYKLTMGYFDIRSRLKRMKCGELDIDYVSHAFGKSKCCSLIQFRDDTLSHIQTILSFSFNDVNNCIEVETFCCDGIGGGTLFNFLINAVNCGISKCRSPYERKIILSALDEALDFYYKYDFEYTYTKNGLDVLERTESSPSREISIDNNDKEIDTITRAINVFYSLRPNPKRKYPREVIEDAIASTIDDTIRDPDYNPSRSKRRNTRNKKTGRKYRTQSVSPVRNRKMLSRSRSRDRHGGTHRIYSSKKSKNRTLSTRVTPVTSVTSVTLVTPMKR